MKMLRVSYAYSAINHINLTIQISQNKDNDNRYDLPQSDYFNYKTI